MVSSRQRILARGLQFGSDSIPVKHTTERHEIVTTASSPSQARRGVAAGAGTRRMSAEPIRSGTGGSGPAPDDALDPQIRQFVSAMAQAWARYPPADTLSIVEMRRIAEEIRAPWRRGGPVMAVTDE